MKMIKKIVKKYDLHDNSSIKDDLEFWIKKTPEERIEALEYLRRQQIGSSERLQRVIRVIQRT